MHWISARQTLCFCLWTQNRGQKSVFSSGKWWHKNLWCPQPLAAKIVCFWGAQGENRNVIIPQNFATESQFLDIRCYAELEIKFIFESCEDSNNIPFRIIHLSVWLAFCVMCSLQHQSNKVKYLVNWFFKSPVVLNFIIWFLYYFRHNGGSVVSTTMRNILMQSSTNLI